MTAKPKTPTATAAPAVTPTVAAIPSIGRPPEPNPFVEYVGSLVAGGMYQAHVVTFTDAEQCRRFKRQLARAGAVHGVSVRAKIDDRANTITYWAVQRITRPRK